MTIDRDDLLNSILASLGRIKHIELEDIPNIDLYMDQVTTFMDKKLKSTVRHPEEDKILTKTMINNYAKNNLLPPPVKKKYSKEHMILLIFIYYYKGILSINDIQTLLRPVTEKYFKAGGEISLGMVYEEVFGLEREEVGSLREDIVKKFEISQNTFQDAPKEDQEILQMFSFICMLSYDVYVKKLLIEKMVDSFGTAVAKEEKAGKPKKTGTAKEKEGEPKKIKPTKDKEEKSRDGNETQPSPAGPEKPEKAAAPSPFIRLLRADEIECRVSTISQKGLSLLLFKDARVDKRILDEAFTPFGWKRTHQSIDGNLYCTVEIWDGEKGQWIAKQDVGTESRSEKEKGQASDSFKRACFNWGLGRELYTAPFIWVPAETANISQEGAVTSRPTVFTCSTLPIMKTVKSQALGL